jgi:hypothetical protein
MSFKMRSCALAAAMAALLGGCGVHSVLLIKPRLPQNQTKVQAVSVFLPQFKEDREIPADDADGADLLVGELRNGFGVVMNYLDLDVPPPTVVRDSIKGFLEGAGYTVVSKKADRTPDMPVVGGKVGTFQVSIDASAGGGFAPAAVADVEFELYVRAGGKVVAERSFAGRKIQHGFAVGIPTIESAGNQAMEEALDKAADFIESREFSDALKGIASKADDKEDPDGE